MPKRSDRKVYAKHFGGNPFEGQEPEKIYRKLKWGNDPNEIIKIHSPEPLVALGYLAALYYPNNYFSEFEENSIHLAVGTQSNFVYFFPVGTKRIPVLSNWKPLSLVTETHYYSDKGNEECYYYHHHEPPFPILTKAPGSSVYVLLPQNYNGKRSYAVIPEGIVG